jgi:hypothetical protein
MLEVPVHNVELTSAEIALVQHLVSKLVLAIPLDQDVPTPLQSLMDKFDGHYDNALAAEDVYLQADSEKDCLGMCMIGEMIVREHDLLARVAYPVCK